MEPTNSRLLATEMQTPMCLPGRISLLLHCEEEREHTGTLKSQSQSRRRLPANQERRGGATHQFNSSLGGLLSTESDKGVASVEAAEGVHHEAEVPDRARLLKQGYQLILK